VPPITSQVETLIILVFFPLIFTFGYVERKRKLTCLNLFFYFWINYFSVTLITRIKMIFHSTNIFVNLIKLMQRVKMGEEKKRTMFFQ
jgi:hypothetical protein